MSLKDKLLKNTTIKQTSELIDSIVLKPKDFVQTPIPVLNLALSGQLDGGITPGLLTIAGPSRSFKSLMGLLLARAYLKKYPDAVMLFYDSEFGITDSYLSAMGIDPKRVVHTPVMNVEELKFDIVPQLDSLTPGDKLFIFVDSIGNLASKKEVEDARDQKSVADMTRAKQIKSLFRIVTPYLVTREIPMVVINHTYESQGMYPTQVIGGGNGILYSSNAAWIMGKRQDKDGDELVGYNFIIGIEKARLIKEKSKIPISVSFDGGISRWSGLMDLALEHGSVTKPKNGWYTRPSVQDDKNWRLADTNSADFWTPILQETDFADWCEKKYKVANTAFVTEDSVDE